MRIYKANLENRMLDERTHVFDGIAQRLPAGEKGVAKIDHLVMGDKEVMESLAEHGAEYVYPGTYARLRINGELMMTDSPMEKRTNLDLVDHARGDVLIAGLGIGMVLSAVLKKPEVEHVTVVERYQDVIDLVEPHFRHEKLTVVGADIHQYHPTQSFDVIYFDIWPNSYEQHLPEMAELHDKFRPHLKPKGWMESWTRQKLLAKQREDKRFNRQLPKLLAKNYAKQGRERFLHKMEEMLGHPDIPEDSKEIVRAFLKEKK